MVATGTPVIALVGNPNAGKTSLFNALTGLHQKVGNYPGVTVEKVSGRARIGDHELEFVDVPGLYSLTPQSVDEEVATNVVHGRSETERRPDLLVCVVDASNLERNLFFLSQLSEIGLPMVVALTMTDVLKRHGTPIDAPRLASQLGVDVIPVIAHKGVGLEELKLAIESNLREPKFAVLDVGLKPEIDRDIEELSERFARNGYDISRAEIRTALTDDPMPLLDRIRDMPELEEPVRQAIQRSQEIEQKACTDPASRYNWAARLRAQVVPDAAQKRLRTSDRIDAILINRFFGLIVFAAIMFVVFQSIYAFSGPLMDGIGFAFDWMGDRLRPLLSGSPILESMLIDGLLTGVGSVLTFLPQIVILFLFISILEGTGYLARAAFLMDRLLSWCGLNGRAFIPLLSSFACAVPGIMATRVMPDPKSRLATILVSPLMSCSARLPVYILLIGAFIQPKFGAVWAGVALFGMHLVGLAVAIPVVLVLNRGIIKGKRLPFVLELPPYQWPKWKDVWLTVFSRAKVFVKTAGSIIVLLSLLIWALGYFPRSDADSAAYQAQYRQLSPAQQEQIGEDNFVRQRQVENSYLGRIGKTIEPVFIPAGFDWRISTTILMAFPAREVVVSSLGIIFNLGSDVDENSGDLRGAIQGAKWPDGRPLMTTWTAVGFMVFFALCCQCMATLAAVKRETNSWKWPLFMFVYMTTLAYLAAVGIHQLGRLFG
ncbi:MAG: ferrous iron transport protein B [Fimbriimonadaceae bacterium]|nr:ferrous iron transport protein B [Fimbriimonadaceae bacterium]